MRSISQSSTVSQVPSPHAFLFNQTFFWQSVSTTKQKSLVASVEDELSDYHRLILLLESQILGSDPEHSSLHKILFWTLEPLSRLKSLALLLENSIGLALSPEILLESSQNWQLHWQKQGFKEVPFYQNSFWPRKMEILLSSNFVWGFSVRFNSLVGPQASILQEKQASKQASKQTKKKKKQKTKKKKNFFFHVKFKKNEICRQASLFIPFWNLGSMREVYQTLWKILWFKRTNFRMANPSGNADSESTGKWLPHFFRRLSSTRFCWSASLWLSWEMWAIIVDGYLTSKGRTLLFALKSSMRWKTLLSSSTLEHPRPSLTFFSLKTVCCLTSWHWRNTFSLAKEISHSTWWACFGIPFMFTFSLALGGPNLFNRPYLGKPSSELQPHYLASFLDIAIRETNARFEEPENRDRLTIECKQPSEGETAWHVVCLGYIIDNPLDSVFSPKAMALYKKIFFFLWKVKKIEKTLSQSWITLSSFRKKRPTGCLSLFPCHSIQPAKMNNCCKSDRPFFPDTPCNDNSTATISLYHNIS